MMIHPHFARHVSAPDAETAGAAVPDIETLQAIVDAAFWTSKGITIVAELNCLERSSRCKVLKLEENVLRIPFR